MKLPTSPSGEKACKPDSVSSKTSEDDGHSSGSALTDETRATYPPCLRPFGQSERAARRGLSLEQGLFGLAPRRDYRVSPRLHSRLLVSVALILPSRGMGVTHSAALWSPDFPPATNRWRATIRPSPQSHYIIPRFFKPSETARLAKRSAARFFSLGTCWISNRSKPVIRF